MSKGELEFPVYSKDTLQYLHKQYDAYLEVFEPASSLADTQFSIQWPWSEFPVEDDIHQVKTEFSSKERQAVIKSLNLFTLYELKAGNEYWGGKILKSFAPQCIKRMAVANANAELNSHAPFYNALNTHLNLDTIEFYESYKQNPVLKGRMDFIDGIIGSKDLAASTLAFSMIEGAALYSTFAFLKHYNVKGGNKLRNVASGINSSVREENLHSLGGALLFNLEAQYNERPVDSYQELAYELATKLAEHEKEINRVTFSDGELSTYTLTQANHFAEHRVDVCLINAGFKPLFKPKYNPVAEWFYDDINSLRLHDFFAQSDGSYSSNWVAESFELEDGWEVK